MVFPHAETRGGFWDNLKSELERTSCFGDVFLQFYLQFNDLHQFVRRRLKKLYMAFKFASKAYITVQVTGKKDTEEK